MHSKKPINCFKFRKLCSTTLQTSKKPLHTQYILHTSNEKFIQRVGDEVKAQKTEERDAMLKTKYWGQPDKKKMKEKSWFTVCSAGFKKQ